jgi:hypothetical protein
MDCEAALPSPKPLFATRSFVPATATEVLKVL